MRVSVFGYILIIIAFISMASDFGFPFVKFPFKKTFISAVERASRFMSRWLSKLTDGYLGDYFHYALLSTLVSASHSPK